MPRSRYVAPFASLFELALAPWRLVQLSAVHLSGAARGDVPRDLPLLLVANHVSWWDGFFLRDVQRRLRPGGPLLTVMLERELRRRPPFRWLGAVGIEPGRVAPTRAMLRTVSEWRGRHGASLAVSYFPQGRIGPSWGRPLAFHRGVALVAERLAPVAIVPVGLHIEPMASARPHAFVNVGQAIVVARGRPELGLLECGVSDALAAVHRLLEARGEDAVRPS